MSDTQNKKKPAGAGTPAGSEALNEEHNNMSIISPTTDFSNISELYQTVIPVIGIDKTKRLACSMHGCEGHVYDEVISSRFDQLIHFGPTRQVVVPPAVARMEFASAEISRLCVTPNLAGIFVNIEISGELHAWEQLVTMLEDTIAEIRKAVA